MAKKSKSPKSTSVKELQSAVKKLRSNLEKAEEKAERWKAKAKKHAAAAATASKKLAKAEKALTKTRPAVVVEAPVLSPAPTPVVTTVVRSETPDDTWNITRLRTAARAKGVANYSRKTKAQLIEDLNA